MSLSAPPLLPELLMADDEAPSTMTVRVDTELVRKARIICAHTPGRAGKQLKLVDYLDSLLRGPINDRYNEVLAEITAAQKAPSDGRRKKPRE